MQPKRWPWRELAMVAGFYLVFAIFYMVVLRFSYPQGYDVPTGLFDYFNWKIVFLDYPLKALWTLPVWYVTFRLLPRWDRWSKMLINLIVLPVWVKGWQLSHYLIIDHFFGGGRLRGPGEWWDVYIPALFYVLQFGIFHAYHYYQDLRRTEAARAESERLALSSELSALKAQLNPHFLYNAFNTISASTGPGQEHTRDMIARLSDLFRYQLRANRAAVLSLKEELDFVVDYLQLEQERFGERLHYRLAVPDDLRGALIPPLLLQPLVENAVRHGIGPLVEGGEIVITATEDGNELTLSVEDSGKGFSPGSEAVGYGIANTRRRLHLLYGASLLIDSSPGNGTRCTFSLPLTYVTQSSRDRRRSTRSTTATGVLG